MPIFQLKINGKSQTVDADRDTPLLWILRDHIDLVGTKYGCGIGVCGACTVHIDGIANESCGFRFRNYREWRSPPLKDYPNMVLIRSKKRGRRLTCHSVVIARLGR